MPPSLQLDFTLPLTFIAIVFPSIKDRAVLAAALVGGFAAVACAWLPLKLGLMLAAACGILAGVLVEALASGRAKA